jgi:transcriptional regulator of acetoin/glycerol metabolism
VFFIGPARPTPPRRSSAGTTKCYSVLRFCQSTGWKIKGLDGAARRLGLNASTLYSRMEKLGIQRPRAK